MGCPVPLSMVYAMIRACETSVGLLRQSRRFSPVRGVAKGTRRSLQTAWFFFCQRAPAVLAIKTYGRRMGVPHVWRLR
jgi:hypothetical protein